jgi:hypothetical protein
MTNNNMIIWEKWRDPFGENDDDINLDNNIENFIDDNSEYNPYDENEKDSQELLDKNKILAKQIRVIATPMGVIPVNDNTASGKIFNFWIGHTNFSITKGVFNVIEQNDGVETLDIFTRYRFRIGIGKAFNSTEVKQNIQESVYDYIEETMNEKN